MTAYIPKYWLDLDVEQLTVKLNAATRDIERFVLSSESRRIRYAHKAWLEQRIPQQRAKELITGENQ